jgi:hypothetical protein
MNRGERRAAAARGGPKLQYGLVVGKARTAKTTDPSPAQSLAADWSEPIGVVIRNPITITRLA